jgi:vitamin B12 transporter
MKRKHYITKEQFTGYLIILFFLIFMGAPLGALAEETSAHKADEKHVSKMDEMVVTATRIEEPKKDISSPVQIISAKDIKQSTAKDAGDLISESGIGHIHKYNGALTSMIEVRGLTTASMGDPLTSRVLVLINGSNAGTANLAKIPTDDIERIEIVKGPASVIYGSSAMGGVINIITKQGKKEGVNGAVYGEGGSFGYWNAGAELSGKKDRFDYYISASRSGQSDYRAAGLGKIENSSYKDETVSGRLGYSLFGDHHASIGFQHWSGWDIGSQGAHYASDPDDYNDKKRDAVDLNYDGAFLNKLMSLKAKYYYIWDRDEWHSTGGMMSGPGNSSVDETDRDAQGALLQNTFAIGDHRITLGGQWDRIKTTSWRSDGAPYNPDSQYDSYGVFSEGRLSLFNKRLLINAGVRYDYFQNEILNTPGITGLMPRKENIDHVTARGGVVYKVTDALSLKGNVGSAFRAPAPLELAADYISWGTHYLGNPDLKPEESITYDAGIDYARGPFRGDFTFFHTDFRKKIVSHFDTTLDASTYRNADRATLEGLELNAAYDIGHALRIGVILEPFVNVTYRTKYLEENNGLKTRLLYMARWTGAMGMRVGQEKWDTRLIVNYKGKEDVTDWNYTSQTYGQIIEKGDFAVVSLKGSYRPIKNLELTASIENLFNKEYEYVLGYPMQGITFVGGAKILF